MSKITNIELPNGTTYDIEADTSEIETEIGNLDDKVSSAEIQIQNLDNSMRDVNADIDNINESIGTINENIGTINTSIDDLEQSKQGNLNAEQLSAVNSGITSEKVATYDGYEKSISDIEFELDSLDRYTVKLAIEKQEQLNQAQLDAVNSGITNNKVNKIDILERDKQDLLTATQLEAVDSGITSDLVADISKTKNDINTLNESKQDKLTTTQLTAVNSGITSSLVADISKTKNDLLDLSYSDIAGGKNLFNINKYPLIDGYYVETNGEIVKSTSGNYKATFAFIPIPSDATITISGVTSDESMGIDVGLYRADKTLIEHKSNRYTFATTSDTKYLRFSVRKTSYNIQIEVGSTPTSYEPFISTNLMLTKEDGNLTQHQKDLEFLGWSVPSECPIQNYVDANGDFHQRVGRVDLGSLTWSKNTSSGHERFVSSAFVSTNKAKGSGGDDNKVLNGYCSRYSADTNNNNWAHRNGNTIAWGSADLYVYDSSLISGDASAFKTAMSGIYLYYELATEVVIKNGKEAVSEIKDSLLDYDFIITASNFDVFYKAMCDNLIAHAPASGYKTVLFTAIWNGYCVYSGHASISAVRCMGIVTPQIKDGHYAFSFSKETSGNVYAYRNLY